ncbi:hydroxymethylbilane synthase [Marinicrinis sediminis]|uniref:Porphobilinogen deaminase n=1 Tax=Marinicrinis sediminis TaxID=1652465 RepID=A0ABW5R649_9BACL
MRNIIVGTRQSALAMTQTEHVIKDLQALCEKHGFSFEFGIKKIVTKGDQILDVTLSKVGGKGLFVKEIEQALYDKEIDIAVHSMKDVPAELREGFVLGAIPEREDPRDCLITKNGAQLDDLPEGAVVGTSSLRRMAQIKAYRPELEVKWIRGNIDTRIKKLQTEGFDAIVLAAAGLKRMGWEDRVHQFLPVEISVPAVGQGALGIECREDDEELLALLRLYHHPQTVTAVTAERTFLAACNGGCQVPIGAYATVGNEGTDEEGLITCTGLIGDPDTSQILKSTKQGTDPVQLGLAIADELMAQGAQRILERFRG